MEFETEEVDLGLGTTFFFSALILLVPRAKKLTSFLPVCGKSTVYAPELILLVRAKQ